MMTISRMILTSQIIPSIVRLLIALTCDTVKLEMFVDINVCEFVILRYFALIIMH